jgi:DNA-binding NarL/FixJ family response regulator
VNLTRAHATRVPALAERGTPEQAARALERALDGTGLSVVLLAPDGSVAYASAGAVLPAGAHAASRACGLTRREAEVLRAVAHGATNADVARALVISPRTVAKHLEHAYRKLGVESRTAAAMRAYGDRA